jgi:hypothetical protein
MSSSCHKCYNTATRVAVIPDPYYGYGHSPTLCCDTCVPSNIFCDEFHTYDPEYDDYYLGFTQKKPPSWSYSNYRQYCYTCQKEIEEKKGEVFIKMGSGYVTTYTNIIEKRKIKENPNKRQKMDKADETAKPNLKIDSETEIVENGISIKTTKKCTLENVYFCPTCYVGENDGQPVHIVITKTTEYKYNLEEDCK